MYIKSLEIDHFKSFANKVTIPFLQGFTTVAGPNGSGKSNIIDSILFALGLSSARTLRAEKLSDYISIHPPKKNEAYVKVTLAMEGNENEELSVARRIKKSSNGYVSIYYLNDKVSTLSDIHLELEKYNITPNCYNVVMQNDVTGIAASSNVDRRKMIEEIAGTAEFDRQTEKAEEELKVVETRVEQTNIVLEELAKTIERLAEERDVALKYEKIKNEKTALESQITAVKYFDLKKSLDLVHANILEFGKNKQEKSFELKEITKQAEETKEKLEKIKTLLKENGESEQFEVIRKYEEIKGKINFKENAIAQADVTIHNNKKRTIFSLENGIELAEKKIQESKDSIAEYETQIKGLEVTLKTAVEERSNILKEITGLNQTAGAFLEQIEKLKKEREEYRVEELEIEKQSVPLEVKISANKKLIAKNKEEKEKIEKAKNDFANDKDRLELEKEELSKALNDYKVIQENSVNELVDIKTEIGDTERDLDIARRKYNLLEAEKNINSKNPDAANSLILNAHLEGVHSSLMNLGSVEEEYSVALEVAMGGRMRNIVVDSPEVAKIAIELLKTNRAGTTTFLPLNKLHKAPSSLNLPKDRGIIDFAINLIDFDDLYLDAFYLALGDTIIVEDYETAKKLQGKYRMVTLSGELFDKSGAITGGDRKSKSTYKFSSSSENELTKWKNKILELTKKYSELQVKKEKIEQRQNTLRENYSNTQSAFTTVKIELNNLIKNAETYDNKIEELTQEIKTAEKENLDAEKLLDAFELKKATINDKTLLLNEEIGKTESKIDNGQLSKLKDSTQEVENRIKDIERKIGQKKNDKENENIKIEFQQTIIQDNKQKIEQTKKDNENLEADKIRWEKEIETLNEELQKYDAKQKELQEKLKQLQEERETIQNEFSKQETQKHNLEYELERINEQIESCRSRRKEIEPQIEEVKAELQKAGIKYENLEVTKLSLDEINTKIQRLQKRMEELEPVNMNAIRSYDEQIKRKEELDGKINVLTKERIEIEQRMSQYEEAKKEAFLVTFKAINEHFKTIFQQLADGEGSLILEDEQNPFNAGMSMIAKPKGKESKKLISLSGGEKALIALALVLAIQKYMPAPFYALDEVDGPLDILNVPKLANMIKEQSKNTQFVVVSHRDDMIKLGNRVLGVSQKGKGITEVKGIINTN